MGIISSGRINVKISKWISMEELWDTINGSAIFGRTMTYPTAAGGQTSVTQTQYFRYEQGYRDIPSDILIALADLYGTSTDYILGRTDDPRFSGGPRGSEPAWGGNGCLAKSGKIWYSIKVSQQANRRLRGLCLEDSHCN